MSLTCMRSHLNIYIRSLALLCLISCATSQTGIKHQQSAEELNIYEIQNMADVERWIIPGTLVLFDLDNTVFEVQDPVGNALFYEHMFGLYPTEQPKILRMAWDAIKKSNVQLVEKETHQIISNLQERGIAVMALTARDLLLREATFRQLKSINIDFRKTAPTGDIRSPFFHDGVLFSSPLFPKGQSILNYLATTDFEPTRIIMIDDVKRNLTSICEKTCGIGLWYPLITRRGGWNQKEAERRWLSD